MLKLDFFSVFQHFIEGGDIASAFDIADIRLSVFPKTA